MYTAAVTKTLGARVRFGGGAIGPRLNVKLRLTDVLIKVQF